MTWSGSGSAGSAASGSRLPETDEHLAGRLRQAVKEVEALMSALEKRGYIVYFSRENPANFCFLSGVPKRPLDLEISKTVRL